ncbi:MAG: hypothetical protein RBS49_01435 [Sphaerochaeta sp.]|jgi:hypothetical protein|nr:hypothetical protein [Sphaerochaeta sp.]MDX9914525.1 hypothetical protein [Sphaerochaeta sp.]
MKGKTLLIRLAVIAVILILSAILFFVGKSHTVLVDNKAVTVDGKEIAALKLVEVAVNKQASWELTPRDRDKFDVTGQKHTVTVAYTDEWWEEHTIVRTFTVPLMQDMVMILVPALVANPESDQSVWLENYEIPSYAVTMAESDEVVVTDDMAGLITDL